MADTATSRPPAPRHYETSHAVNYNDMTGGFRVVRERKALMVLLAQFVSLSRHS